MELEYDRKENERINVQESVRRKHLKAKIWKGFWKYIEDRKDEIWRESRDGLGKKDNVGWHGHRKLTIQ